MRERRVVGLSPRILAAPHFISPLSEKCGRSLRLPDYWRLRSRSLLSPVNRRSRLVQRNMFELELMGHEQSKGPQDSQYACREC